MVVDGFVGCGDDVLVHTAAGATLRRAAVGVAGLIMYLRGIDKTCLRY